jgi:hypothetical protein
MFAVIFDFQKSIVCLPGNVYFIIKTARAGQPPPPPPPPHTAARARAPASRCVRACVRACA